MLLAQVGIYIFLLVFTLYLSYRALWIVFFLFNFRFWEMILEKFASVFMGSLSPIQQFLLLAFISLISYTALFFTTMRMPLIRYILLAILFIAAIRIYSLTDILFFKDYFVSSGMWDMDYWITQIKELFSFKEGDIVSIVDNIMQVFVEFFMKIIDAVRQI